MARLVAVCRDGEEDFPFLARQIPLYIDDTLTMVMEFTDSVMNLDTHQINSSQMKQFVEHHSMLKQQDLNIAMMVTSREVFSALAQLVPCVGCRRSVERLFSQLVESGNPALEPLTVKPTGVLSVTKACMADAKMLYTLFYVHGSKLNDTINAIPKSKKNKRCQLHSLDTHKPKPLGGEGSVDKMLGLENNKDGGAKTDSRCSVVFPFGRCPAPSRGSWMDVWELMSQECRDEVVLIDSACLLETLETYLRKHRFCTDCKNKVLRAYNILVGELDCTKEKGYCAALYEGLRCCPHERHVHVCCETDFMAHLLGRAEPERRERHAKTIDIAQEEVLTCLGIHLYERLHRIWQKLRAEEQTWQMLFYLGIDALRKSFELCEELSEEERAKELKQEKKRQKKKNRRKNKCSFDGSLESVESGGGCKACGSREGEGGHVGCVEVVVTSNESPTSCSCPDGNVPILGSPKVKKGNAATTIQPSLKTRHLTLGDYLCGHHCAEDKEDGGVDSCVECWANSKENTKKKKKTRKNKGLLSYHQGPNAEGCVVEENRRAQNTAATSPVCRTKETCAQLCLDTCSSIALPWGEHRKNMSYCLEANICGQEDTNAKSLMELLDDSEVTSDDENCLTQDEIQSFVDNNKSFYNNRDQYRQHLKDKFTKYCRGGGDWFAAAAATTSVN
ncbi:unnamed protein product [Coregonus sp. 'balchen']|nr:unnamed protein product [Coregonus sp. 'balchen']